jgi:hypothetical protein
MVELAKKTHHLTTGFRVEVAGRLIGKNDARARGQRPRNRYPLLLAARQLQWRTGRALAQSDPFEHGLRLLPARLMRHAGIHQRQRDIVECRQLGQQVEALKHETDFTIAQGGQLIR